jgi:hypothetical protein
MVVTSIELCIFSHTSIFYIIFIYAPNKEAKVTGNTWWKLCSF